MNTCDEMYIPSEQPANNMGNMKAKTTNMNSEQQQLRIKERRRTWKVEKNSAQRNQLGRLLPSHRCYNV